MDSLVANTIAEGGHLNREQVSSVHASILLQILSWNNARIMVWNKLSEIIDDATDTHVAWIAILGVER
jgi:hypothetical protein